MSYATNLWLFLMLLAGIIIVPGMDMLFVLSNTLAGGRRAGFAATAGIAAGGVGHTLWGAFGAGVLALWLPQVFTLLVVVGAGYMIWIGASLMRTALVLDVDAAEAPVAGRRSSWRAFRQGALTCLVNPKAYVFILAVYPQFVKPHFGPIWAQALVMGLMTALMQLAIYGALALAAARGRDALVANPGLAARLGRGAGALIVAVALVTLWQGLAGPAPAVP